MQFERELCKMEFVKKHRPNIWDCFS